MRWLVIPAVLSMVGFVPLCSQSRPDTLKRRASADTTKPVASDTAKRPAPTTLQRVVVRAQRRRVPSLMSGAISDQTSRAEPQSYQLLDPLTQGGVGSLLGASPEFVATANGQFSLMGGPGESNQLTIGGVRMPSGFVTGAVRSSITASPWDVSNGGAAGATVNLGIPAGNMFRSVYMVVRTSVSGSPGAESGTANVPVQLNIASDGPVGRFRYSVNGFASRDAVSLRRWDVSLAPATKNVLDSLARMAGTPLLRTSEVQQQFGLLTRLDLQPVSPGGPQRKSAAFALALSRTSNDAGSRGAFNAASAAFATHLDVGALQFESARIVRNTARVTTNVSLSSTAASTNRFSDAPVIQLSDSAIGALAGVGGSAPQAGQRINSAEVRSQGAWYSADNTRRYLLQVQVRYDAMRVGSTEPGSAFNVASVTDLQRGRAVAMTRTAGSASAGAQSVVLAPAASVGFEIGRRGSMLIGARADAWAASDIVRGATIRHIDLSPRISFHQQIGRRSKGRGAFGTLRGGVGRFTDWPSLQQWSSAWGSTDGQSASCTGASVPMIDFAAPASDCLGVAEVVSTGRLFAARTLQPVSSTRGELSLQVHQLLRGVRAEFGFSASEFNRVAIVRTPYFGAKVQARLAGESGRALIIDPAVIGSNGIVPLASLPEGDGSRPFLVADGRSTGYQYRVRLASRDPWSLTQLEANYAWNGGTRRGAFVTPAFAAPGLISAATSGNRHTIMASIGSWVGVSQIYATLIVRSGVRFTPLADQDLNGDGLANDAAFVPLAQAEAWAAATPAATRSCIRDAAGTVIAPNACAGPWSVSSILTAQIPGPKVGLPRGMELTVQLSNPTALFSSIGGGGVTFGASPFVSPTLVRVTGFDASTQRFGTELLQGFGRPIGLSRSITEPMRVAVSLRVPLGRSAFDRRMNETVGILAADTTSSMRERVAANVFAYMPNIPEVFLEQITRVELTREQREQLGEMKNAWQQIAPRAVATLTARSSRDPAAREALIAARSRAVEEVQAIMVRIANLLTPSQRAVLEPYEATLLNLRLIRWTELSAYPF